MRSRHLGLLVGAGLLVVACRGDDEKKTRAWTCGSIAIPGGETIACRSSALTSDGPSGSTTDGTGGSSPSGSTIDGTGEGEVIVYDCNAGEADCPPVGAGGTQDGTAGDAPSSTGDDDEGRGGKTDDGTEGGEDGDDGKGKGDGKSKGGDERDDGSSAGEGGGTGDGTTSGDETYRCKKDGDTVDCRRKRPTRCDGGTTPGDGRCVSSDGTTPGTTTSNCISVGLKSETPNSDGTTTWTYEVCEKECAQDLSNWVLATGTCVVTSGSPRYEDVRPDPNAGLVGVKWETGAGFTCGTFTLSTRGGTRGPIEFATKAPGVAKGVVDGPVCDGSSGPTPPN